MTARGALIKPWLFRELTTGYWDISAEERVDVYRRYVELATMHWGAVRRPTARRIRPPRRARPARLAPASMHTATRGCGNSCGGTSGSGFATRHSRPDGSWPTMQQRESAFAPRSPLEALLARHDDAALDYITDELIRGGDLSRPPDAGASGDCRRRRSRPAMAFASVTTSSDIVLWAVATSFSPACSTTLRRNNPTGRMVGATGRHFLGLPGVHRLRDLGRVFERELRVRAYLSPFYSPLLFGPSPHAGSAARSRPGGRRSCTSRPPSLILWAPVGFRFTCYYYRGAYYKAFWADPPGCAVGEPRKTLLGERSFPLILQNIHRYFLYIALVFLVILAYDAWQAMWFPADGRRNSCRRATQFGIGVGTHRARAQRRVPRLLHVRLPFAAPPRRRLPRRDVEHARCARRPTRA